MIVQSPIAFRTSHDCAKFALMIMVQVDGSIANSQAARSRRPISRNMSFPNTFTEAALPLPSLTPSRKPLTFTEAVTFTFAVALTFTEAALPNLTGAYLHGSRVAQHGQAGAKRNCVGYDHDEPVRIPAKTFGDRNDQGNGERYEGAGGG